MAKPSGREIHAGQALGQGEGGPDGDGDGQDRRAMADDCSVPTMIGQAPNSAPHGMGHAVGVRRWPRSCCRRFHCGPGEEAPPVDPDGRPGLDDQDGEGEDQRGQGEQDGHPGTPPPGVLLVGSERRRPSAGTRRPGGWPARVRGGGDGHRAATGGRHYEMAEDLLERLGDDLGRQRLEVHLAR